MSPDSDSTPPRLASLRGKVGTEIGVTDWFSLSQEQVDRFSELTDDWDYMAGNGIRRELSTDELIEVFAAEPLRFEPGSEHEYSNPGYVLLGAVIERASGMPWDTFLSERIFEPLGMADTRGEPATALVPRKASGYEERGGSWHNASFLSMTQPHAAGALVSTVLDTVTRKERALLVQEQLVAMPADERAEMLGSIFGLMTKEQRKEIEEKLAKTSAI